MRDADQRLPTFHDLDPHRVDRDACALICAVRKGGQATHGNEKRTIESWNVITFDEEGDGVGILVDILQLRQVSTFRLNILVRSMLDARGNAEKNTKSQVPA